MNKVFNTDSFFAFLLFFSISMPSFSNSIGNAGVILVNGLILFLLFFYFFLKYNYLLKFEDSLDKRNALNYIYFISFFVFLMPLSTAIGVFWGGVSVIERDFYEFYRPVFYSLIFIFSYSFFSKNYRVLLLEKYLFYLFVIIVLFGLNHFFRMFDSISELYTKPKNISTLRVSTPFVNPYDYAFVMSFFAYYFFFKLMYERLYYIILFVVAVFMLILPQSRSVAIGFLVGFFFIVPIVLTYLGFTLKTARLNKKLLFYYFLLFFVFVSFLLSLPYLLEDFKYLTGQFVRLLENGSVGNSANLRMNQFLFALGKAENNPFILFFGNGPAKNEMEYVESIYNYLFYRYGIAGVLFYFFILVVAIIQGFKILKKIGQNSKNYALFLGVILWFITIPFLSIGNNFTEQFRISFFYYTLLGFVASSYYQIVLKKI
ncbi:hypothetical protein [Marinomonas sp. TW1]|uniref:hypothetical protein n=1 Tax=Marinomonas sp. TW1 TaxID=1561203 RepID=UPI0007AF4530|nr:hypothetical protein [Marinomonas sp. TW1]KZN15065.1 hypothetical protein OA79_02365 [Marinomonas sp. TW1]